MTTEMQEVPTAQYYSTTDPTLVKLIRLVAILGIILGGTMLSLLIVTAARRASGGSLLFLLRVDGVFYLTQMLWWPISGLMLGCGIGCLNQKERARRGMVLIAILSIAVWTLTAIGAGLSMASPSRWPSDTAGQLQLASILIGVMFDLLLRLVFPLLVLVLFRSHAVKQLFRRQLT